MSRSARLTSPARERSDRRRLAVALLGALAFAALALLSVGVVPGARVGFLLGGAGGGSGGGLSPVVGQLQKMATPIAVLGAATGVLGGMGGGVLLMAGHPHGAKVLGRVAMGALAIAACSTVVH